MIFREIKTSADIQEFLEKTNSLHDGYILGVNYANTGIAKIPGGHSMDVEKTRLVLQILVTSIEDAVVEIVFETVWDWQITDPQLEILDTAVLFDKKQRIVWWDDEQAAEDLKHHSYVIAESMKWRFAAQNESM